MKKYVDLYYQIISGTQRSPEIEGPKIEKIMFSVVHEWMEHRSHALFDRKEWSDLDAQFEVVRHCIANLPKQKLITLRSCDVL